MCVSPYIVRNKDGDLVPVPCGKCFQCMQQWSMDWKFRLKQEQKHCAASVYLTLTYNSENLPVAYNDEAGEWQSYLVKSDLQKFLKRVRFNCKELKFRYFAVGEYGGDYNRCHFHVVFFLYNTAGMSFNQLYRYFFQNWRKGFIYLKSTENRHLNYTTKYFNKIDKSSHITEPFKCMSKSIGLCFLTERMKRYFFDTFATSLPNPFGKGFVKLPRYYRKKLDEYTYDMVENSEGYVWSDIVRMKPFEPKGLAEKFDYFCKNYNDILHVTLRHELSLFRKYGIHPHEFVNPNELLDIWSLSVPDIMNARAESARQLRDAEVHHKYTKLKEIEILYGSS